DCQDKRQLFYILIPRPLLACRVCSRTDCTTLLIILTVPLLGFRAKLAASLTLVAVLDNTFSTTSPPSPFDNVCACFNTSIPAVIGALAGLSANCLAILDSCTEVARLLLTAWPDSVWPSSF